MEIKTLNSIKEIKLLRSADGFANIDLEFADFILRITKPKDINLYLAAAIVSYSIRQNNICTSMKHFAGQTFPDYTKNLKYINDSEQKQIILPSLPEWRKSLEKFPDIVSAGEKRTPLVFDKKDRLYLYRYWNYEQKLSDIILEKSAKNSLGENDAILKQISGITKLFPKCREGQDWQQVAVFAALNNYFTVITGAPGTGKTTVVSVIIALFLLSNLNMKIGMCAPTGKAAARLKEAIKDELSNLNCSDEIKTVISQLETSTIHRLLKVIYNTPYFRHNSENQLDLDVLIVDEASMISQPLMYKLFRALPEKTRIILFGDKDQLASVEAGAVFADICECSEINRFSMEFCEKFNEIMAGKLPGVQIPSNKNFLENNIVSLQRSYRFDDNKGIGLLKKAVNGVDGDIAVEKALKVAKQESRHLNMQQLPSKNLIESMIIEKVNNIQLRIDGKMVKFFDYLNSDNIERSYKIFSEFRILCSHRNSVFGIYNINRIIREYLFKDELFPAGLPLMITENDAQLKLFNGDIGIVRKEKSRVKVYFPDNENSKLFRSFLPAQLPAFETVFAMTIHKSQGSGFQKMLMILPDRDSSLLTRELVYTGITRAKEYCELWINDDIFKKAVKRRIQRDSGLKDELIKGL